MTFFSRESILRYGIVNWRSMVRSNEALVKKASPSAEVITLRSAREVRAFIGSIGQDAKIGLT